ncbi:MAG: 50S ribosomal protein L7ae [Lachnospiraceae bacterium]|uniref:50S ribosomal protein L7ae n=1 Tax=Candidatus Weimeria bifida TaxID=2599074 RepID=A0A6N7IZ66_9FIRM|nr:50S ribosomal protein L7ae [Candidatus Weimeria bifida]RRF96061.1 MAG: 50S ribosomal protein L7ae [Lachnospiraceae bacterium]
MLSLSKKAGRLKSGAYQTEDALKSGKACLVIVSSDASENTRKHFSDMASFRHVPFRIYSDSGSLGSSVGAESRMSMAVTDHSFAEKILELIDNAADTRRS